MIEIQYRKGNVLAEIGSPGSPLIIPHICNNVGAFGAGFALAVRKKYPAAHDLFTMMDRELGSVGFCQAGENVWIANMIAQNGLRSASNRVPLDYDALTDCLYQVAGFADHLGGKPVVKAPRFGAGLAGGKWPRIELIINQTLIHNRIPVTIFDLDAQSGSD